MINPYKNYRTLRRYQQIIMTLARFGFGELVGRLNLFSYLKLKKATAIKKQPPQVSRAVRFRLMLEQLGPSFIKLGQILSTRADLLPPDIVTELANLQDHVTPTEWPAVKTRLDNIFGSDFETIFPHFNSDCIASASIAQVYEATLHTGERVAVKIIRPNTEKTIKEDLAILEHLAGLIQTHIEEARHWNIHDVVDQFRTSIGRELDLQHEGRNADLFRANFAQDPTVCVPIIYWEYTSRHILVMEFIDGQKISEFFDPDIDLETRKMLAYNGANAVLRQIFEHGFFQADPHPGNAFVLPGNVICWLDFGMFGRLDDNALDSLARALHAIVKKDIDRLLKAGRQLDVFPDQADSPNIRIAVIDLLEQYHGIPLKQINVPQLLRDITQLVNRYHVHIRPDFLFLIKALGTIEATGRKLDPDFDILSHVEPFIQRLYLKMFSPQRLLKDAHTLSEDLAELTRESPEHLLEILRKFRSGEVKLEFVHKGLEVPFSQLNQMSDKIVLGLILAALIIASALMAHVRLGPLLFGYPVIGGFGFLVAGIAGLWIIIDILRSRRR